MRRVSIAQASTRKALLDAGVELLIETGVTPGVNHVKMADAAHRAGYTSGAAYGFWANQQDFQRDLVVEMLRHRSGSAVTDTVKCIRRLVDSGAPFLEVIRAGTEANVHRWPDDAKYFTTLMLRATTMADPELRTFSHRRLVDALSDYVDLYGAMLKVARRRMRAPYTIFHLAALFAAMAEGFSLQEASGLEHPRFERDEVCERVGSEWTLLGIAVETLIEVFTEPDVPASRPAAGACSAPRELV